MKSVFFCLLLMLTSYSIRAQYYYLDILGTKQANEQYSLLRSLRYKTITAKSYDGNGELTKDFVLEQNISPDGKQITTRSASVGSAETVLTSYFENSRVMKTLDSSDIATTTITYEYDNEGRVSSITSTAKDFDGAFTTTETRRWTYNAQGQPEKMLRIKNQLDTTTVVLKADDENKIGEEKWLKKTRNIETYYYYHNAKGQLTDIVRYSKKAKTMLPDFVFEYDNAGRVVQMTQAQPGSASYLVWKYKYNDNGLKSADVVYNKNKELLGRVEYSYQ